jgi:long-chain acyl-CoA synthetase
MSSSYAPQLFPECSALTLPGLLRVRAAKTPNDIALWQLDQNRNWRGITWGQFLAKVSSVARSLKQHGLKSGDRVAIIADTSIEWDVAQIAITAAGGIAVGLDPHGLNEHLQTIARRCMFVAVFASSTSLVARIGQEAESLLRFRITFEATSPTGWISFSDLLNTEVASDGSQWDLSEPSGIATIIFTSGTTGAPKGIAYSHRQICLATTAILSCFPDIKEGSRLICWLPLSNLFQRIINLCGFDRGAEVYYLSDPTEVMRYVSVVAPHLFIAVPRFFEKLYAGIQAEIAAKSRLVRGLIRWALKVGHANALSVRSEMPISWILRLKWALADRLVLRKFRGLLGDNLQFMISGSAPMPLWLLEHFHAMGFLILEAYGLSENVIPVALNRPNQYRFGTVGQVLPGCEVYIADDTELLVRGPGVFGGYVGEPLENSPVRQDGYLPSGDFAQIDSDGYISLIGRKADIFKTSTGRRIAPAEIEGVLRQISIVDNVAVFGAQRSQPVALLTVNGPEFFSDPNALSEDLRRQVEKAVAVLPGYLRPAGVVVSAVKMTIDGGELTTNLKLRRSNVESKYRPALQQLYVLLDQNKGNSFIFLSTDQNFLYISV